MPMKSLLAVLAMSMVSVSSAVAFDAPTQAVIATQKTGKPVAIAAVATLMGASERWCYLEEAGSCAWSDVYLAVGPHGASFEISNAWDENTDIAFIDHGTFEAGKSICETNQDWLPSVRALRREDGTPVSGRALRDLKVAIAEVAGEPARDCFDYVYRGSDAGRQTVTLLQRQSRDGVHDPDRDTLVTLHFDPAAAQALTLRW
tara:strand:- start:25155 stop:25763 length:609 start_codon:yes stop_codon:yes gene_type:complete